MDAELFDILLLEVHSLRSVIAGMGVTPPTVPNEIYTFYYIKYNEPIVRGVVPSGGDNAK